MKHHPIRILVLLAASFSAVALAAPAQAATPYCGIAWGSTAERTPVGSGGEITDVRAGRHDCYDRLVIDLRGSTNAPATTVAYVGEVRQDPSDRPVGLRGGAFLQITVQSPDHTPDHVLTYDPTDRRELADVAGFRTFRQVAHAGSFEGVTTVGLGVRARLPFRVFTLSSGAHGSRVVVDVAHRW
jgi:hypothetical protein